MGGVPWRQQSRILSRLEGFFVHHLRHWIRISDDLAWSNYGRWNLQDSIVCNRGVA